MRIYLILLLGVVLFSCSNQFEGYTEQDSGLHFKLNTLADSSKRIQNKDYIQFKYKYQDYKGNLLEESRILLKVNDVDKKGGLVEALSLLNEKEQGSFVFPYKKLSDELDGAFTFPSLQDTSFLFATIQVDSVYTEEGFYKAQKKFVQWVNEVDTREFDVIKEELLLDQYERDHHLTTQKTPTSLRYFKTKKGSGEAASFGKRVEVAYKGRFLNGETFNSTKPLPNGTQDFYIGQELQVIKGIEEALLLMKEGDVLTLLMPSWIAFGKNGSATGIVPAKTPVVYEVELKKVN